MLRRLNPVIQGEDAALLTFTFANGAVGASGTADFKESYSNWGSLVDIYAPGGKCV